jgi:hypothetical protein
MVTEKQEYKRIRRVGKLVASEHVTLPVGICDPETGTRYKEIIIDEMLGKDEENVAKKKIRRNGAKGATVLLRRCVQEIPGLMEQKSDPLRLCPVQYIREWMTQPDRDFLFISILVTSMRDETYAKAYCKDCDESFSEKQSFTDFPIYDWPDNAPLYIDDEFPQGYKDSEGTIHKDFRLKFPDGTIQENVIEQGRGNEGLASSLLLAACIDHLGTLDGIDTDIASRIKFSDRRYIGRMYREKFPGMDLIRQLDCPSCGETFEVTVDLTGFFEEVTRKKS